MYTISVTARAQKDTKSAIEYYDDINPELATRFISELTNVYEKLSLQPQLYSFVRSDRESNIRDVKIKSFPFVVIFEIRKKRVMIISIRNVNRKPVF